MYAKEIKYLLDQYVNYPHNGLENGRKLMVAICNYIIEKESPEEEQITHEEPTEEKYLSITEFSQTYRLCHGSHITRIFNENPAFFRWCGKKKGSRFSIEPKRALAFLSQADAYPQLRNKARVILEQKENI